jgi:hypothetical protein
MSMTIKMKRWVGRRWRQILSGSCASLVLCIGMASSAAGQERLCDSSFEDCRAPIVQLIRNENVGIDVSFWFMTDTTYSTEIIRRWNAS